jgi:methylase of polypeptide subunit release factors
MPRLSQSLIRSARQHHPHLPYLLRTCRDLQSAKLELKWLQEHVKSQRTWSPQKRLSKFEDLCRKRGRGVPIQYLLGSEYFGPLEIQCKPGVLIPRPATADAVLHLLRLLRRGASELPPKLKVLDLCSGTGCISLLFGHSYPHLETNVQEIEICGVDLSSNAIQLSELNRQRILRQLLDDESSDMKSKETIRNTKFILADVFKSSSHVSKSISSVIDAIGCSPWDIIISNPPYVSPSGFRSVTSRSVRLYEPRLALVPKVEAPMSDDEHGDSFYPRLLDIAKLLQSKLLLLEVGDMNQAERVASMAQLSATWSKVEIWKDDPRQQEESRDSQTNHHINILGSGDGRFVLCYTIDGASWIGRHVTPLDSLKPT